VPDAVDTKALVLEFWLADLENKDRFVTDEVVWHLPNTVARAGLAQELRGDDVRTLFRDAGLIYERPMTWDIGHVVADQDLVALHCTMHGRMTNGEEYHGSYHMLFRIADGRIAEGWEFLDTAYVMELLGPS
jgi:ketosteroid isomerase-like protein